MEELETIIIELLVNTSAACSQALATLQLACKGNFSAIEQAMTESREYIRQAHETQTQLIGIDEDTGKLPVNLVTVHSQDHLMNATVTQDLVGGMIEPYWRLSPVN